MARHIWIVIVNYRTANLAVDCLHSIAAQIVELPRFHTAVVDNASGDGSVGVPGGGLDTPERFDGSDRADGAPRGDGLCRGISHLAGELSGGCPGWSG